MLFTDPVPVAVVETMNITEFSVPNRTSLLSRFPLDWFTARFERAGFDDSARSPMLSITMNMVVRVPMRIHPCLVLPVITPVSYTHLRAHETPEHLVCRLLLEK